MKMSFVIVARQQAGTRARRSSRFARLIFFGSFFDQAKKEWKDKFKQ
jgi:hypothetical protein